jgi:hypothetical protein
MYDLNELLSPAAQGLTVTSPVAINDRGQILANSTFNGGFGHPVILTPLYP